MPPSPIQALFQHAMALHRAGRLAEAEQAYRQIMRADPRDYPSRCMLGRLYLDQGRDAEAEKVLEAAVKLDGRAPPGLTGYGLALLRTGKFRQAAAVLERAVAAEPQDWSLRCNLGDALRGLGRPDQAIAAYDQALALAPATAEALGRRAAARLELGQAEAALADIDRALAASPGEPQALVTRAEALAALGRTEEAILAFGQALAATPNDPELLVERARLLLKAERAAEAVADCTAALARAPGTVAALQLRGAAFARLRQPPAALADAEAVVALARRDPEAHFVRALRLEAMGGMEAAVGAYEQALSLWPRTSSERLKAMGNRAAALIELQRYGEAIEALRAVLAAEPEHPYALGAYAHALRHACDWSDADAIEAALREAVLADRVEIPPGALAACIDDPALALTAARNYAARNLGPVAPPPAAHAHVHAPGERIRLAYVSADFHEHATLRLAIELFERHDRRRFETFAVSLGPDDGGPLRARAVAAFDHFIDAQAMSDQALAELMRERGIDIAVDLKGFTSGARPQLFARRAAPIQVNFLGFPGTLGSEAFDYILADPVVAPLAMQPCFVEQIVHLPGSYQPNDSRRAVPATTLGRAEAGLPEDGLVFCCFNNSYKITPAVFDVWMRLLAQVDGAALWLLDDNSLATANLRKQAAARGVDQARLVFAPRVAPEAHLARHRLADLFLDTNPYGAHTTASDALWMGLPVLTFPGQAFPARVCASLCRAAGLDALVAADLADYERLALALASERGRIAHLRVRLETDRLSLPLFDAEAYRQGVEAALVRMAARHRAGDPPAPIVIEGA